MNDPDCDLELAALREKARKKFGAYIQFVKEQVGAGQGYNNGLVRVVLSERGGYYEMINCPEEFSGFVGKYKCEFTDTSASLKQLEEIVRYITQNSIQEETDLFSLIVLYSQNILDDDNIYILYWDPQNTYEPYKEMGQLQQKLPDFYKARWSLKPYQDRGILPFQDGTMFFVKNMTDQHLVVRIPSSGKLDLCEEIDATVH